MSPMELLRKWLGHPEEIYNLLRFKMGGCRLVTPRIDPVRGRALVAGDALRGHRLSGTALCLGVSVATLRGCGMAGGERGMASPCAAPARC